MFIWFKRLFEKQDRPKVWSIPPRQWERKEKFKRYMRFGIISGSMQDALETAGVPKIGDVITVQMVCESIEIKCVSPSTFHACVEYREFAEA